MTTDTDLINGSADTCILFGPFRLLPRQRLIMEADKCIRLGSRAFDVLLALLERPGELVSKEELMARVWPNTFVEAANLAVHISALRRALGDGRGGNRYVINIPGRGYRFVAPVTFVEDIQQSTPATAPRHDDDDFGAPPIQPKGAAEMNELADQLPQSRLVAVVGAGAGSNATGTLALLQRLIGAHQDRVWLVDLTSLDASRVAPGPVPSA